MRPAAQPAQAPRSGVIEIQIARRQLHMSEDDYRAMLWGVARAKSSLELDHAGRAKVLAHLVGCGYKRGTKPNAPPRKAVAPDKAALWGKLGAMLAEAGRAQAYADGMAKHMFGVAKAEWCEPHQLHKLVAALVYDQKRRAAKAGKAATPATPATTPSGSAT